LTIQAKDLELKEELFYNLATLGGAHLITGSESQLCGELFPSGSNLVFVEVLDGGKGLGVLYGAAESGHLGAITIRSGELNDVRKYMLINGLIFPCIILVVGAKVEIPKGLKYCSRGLFSLNVSKACTVAVESKEPVVIFLD